MMGFRGIRGARGMLLMGGGTPLSTKVKIWQDAQTDLIHSAGIAQASWTATAGVSGNKTFISPANAIRQDGYIYRVVLNLGANCPGGADDWKFKIVRWNSVSSKYDVIYDITFRVSAAGAQVFTKTFTTPLAVQAGDIPAVYTGPLVGTPAKMLMGEPKTLPCLYAIGDITTNDAFGATYATGDPEMEIFTHPPYLAVTGDSYAEGHHGTTNYHGGLHDYAVGIKTNPGGERTSDIGYMLRTNIGASALQYQNLGLGSQDMSWVAATGIPAAVATKAHDIAILHSFVNDNARAWADIETDLGTIKAAFAASTAINLLISEAIPYNVATDPQAAAARAINTNLVAWVAANNNIANKTVKRIAWHDALAQVRISTGELDDQLYPNASNIHLSATGVMMAAGIVRSYL